MKINVDIECSPEEARAFLGLPDVRPMQEALLRGMQERLSAGMTSMPLEEMLRLWSPGARGLDALQDAMLKMSGAKRD